MKGMERVVHSVEAVVVLIAMIFVVTAFSEHDDIPSQYGEIPEYFLDDIPRETIIGGENATSGEFPWQVSIQYILGDSTFHLCGGSIVAENFVLTTGRCVSYLTSIPHNVRAVAGRLSLYDCEYSEQTRPVEKIILHPRYRINQDPFSIASDLALLKLTNKFYVTPEVGIIPLPPQGYETPDGPLLVAGWGALLNGEYADTLQKVPVSSIDVVLCRVWLGHKYQILATNICAGEASGGKAACSGDEGSSLSHKNEMFLSGVFSWNPDDSCGKQQKPGVYTRVSSYSNWITQNIRSG